MMIHPLVGRLDRESTAILQVLHDGADDAMTWLMLALRQGSTHGDGGGDALLRARQFDFSEHDHELTIVFLCLWADLAGICRLFDEAAAVLRRVEAMLTSEQTPVVDAFYRLVDGRVAHYRGDLGHYERQLRAGMERLTPSHPRYAAWLGSLALALAEEGRLSTLPGDADERAEQLGDAMFNATTFIQDVEAWHLSAAWQRRDWVVGEGRQQPFQYIAASLERHLDILDWSSSWVQGAPPKSGWPKWGQAVHALCQGDAQGARRLAARIHDESQHHAYHSFVDHNLLRCELACGRVEVAERLLEGWSGHPHCVLYPFFRARLDLLRSDRGAAHEAFAQAQQLAAQNGASERLAFECRLSLELGRDELFRLMQASAGVVSYPEAPRPSPRQRPVLGLLGRSSGIQRVRDAIGQFAPLQAVVLISGETGTGKELVARGLHEQGRRGRPFVAVNCGAIAESLMASELFGHVRGAFTGAVSARKGVFEEAGDGTLFLDEIGELTPRMQAALLRVLDRGEVLPVGASVARQVACRVIAATHRPLAKMAADGQFRKDLLYRLTQLDIVLPPLRERGEDVLLLAEHFLNGGYDDAASMSEGLCDALCGYDWPGNVRELRHVMERMRLLAGNKACFEQHDLPPLGAVSKMVAPAADNNDAMADNASDFIRLGKSKIRRLERLRRLFAEHHRLTRKEVAAILAVSDVTATKYLNELVAEGEIVRIKPTDAPRTFYFEHANAQ